MLFKDYVIELNKLLKDRPEAGACSVVYSKDDEGNSFHEVYYKPYLGNFDGEDFAGETTEDGTYSEENNAVCIN